MRETPTHPGRPKHDAAYKSLFARRRTVEDTLRAIHVATATGEAAKRDSELEHLVRHLDFSTLERMPASFVTEHLGRRHADMLWRIRIVDETWFHVMVLFEFQSTVDRRMAFRTMNYAGGILTGLGSDDLGPGGVFPLVLPVVVYSGRRRWTAPVDMRDLLAPEPHELLGSRPRHRYLLIDLQRLDPASLPEENVLSMIAALERVRSPERLEELALSLSDRAERAGAQELLDIFREWISQVLVMRYGPRGRGLELRIRNREEARMSMLIERARQWGEELNQEWLEKGLQKGLQRGLEKGRLEGERELVRRLVADRFGDGAAQDFVAVLADISDSDRLAAIAAGVFTCETVVELVRLARGDATALERA
ncbi:MAG: Rpn family recombination-promoting nuclease/putative transposase [Gemmatimonadota bacterium]|nr:Rpn family recombination-promoting nuclease/putative transposase [Gemmatimonadota bacterium]MDE2986195.1 Rpn family recombination-promoting nuclease/putative transposase [Gemmatimonadota bacterium]